MRISYAQNFEDIIIARLFAEDYKGFYIDIGAAHPRKDSVTKFFYDRGWSGINVEPNHEYHELLLKKRKRDTNLCQAISNTTGKTNYFFVKEDPKISFISDDETTVGDSYKGKTIIKREMPVSTLQEVITKFGVTNIDFLKIDVEGAEKLVLEGANLSRIPQPKLIIVESVNVNGEQVTNADWEPILLEHNYKSTYFDGINSYFIKSDDSTSAKALATPLNNSDQFIPVAHTKMSYLLKILAGKFRGSSFFS